MKSSSGYIRLPEHAETNCSGHCSRRTGTRRARGSGDGIPSTRAGVARPLARAASQTSETGCWTYQA